MKFTGKERKMYMLALGAAGGGHRAGLYVDDVGAAFEPDIAERRDAHAGALGNARGGRNAAVGGDASPRRRRSLRRRARSRRQTVPETPTRARWIPWSTIRTTTAIWCPCMCKVPAEDGIAKATLSPDGASPPHNDMQAARLGLRTVLPENMSIDLDIAGGLARIDLGKEALDMPDAAAESNMITAVVQTLTEFPTVEKVEFLVGGQKLETLPHGTSVSGQFTRERPQPRDGLGGHRSGGRRAGDALLPRRRGRRAGAGDAHGLFRAGHQHGGAGAVARGRAPQARWKTCCPPAAASST